MSLKQFLVEQDRINFARRNGDFSLDTEQANGSRKRKLGDVEMNGGEDVDAAVAASKRRKVVTDGFLDCGSVSWSMLLSIFFLSLHKGSNSDEGNSNSDKFCLTLESCIEMLEVLAHEFGDMIPLETQDHVLEANAPGSLI